MQGQGSGWRPGSDDFQGQHPNLALNDEVIDAVRDGKFNIYAVSTIDDGIEVLTGTPAGQRNGKGEYPEGTVDYLVEQLLDELAKRASRVARPSEDPRTRPP